MPVQTIMCLSLSFSFNFSFSLCPSHFLIPLSIALFFSPPSFCPSHSLLCPLSVHPPQKSYADTRTCTFATCLAWKVRSLYSDISTSTLISCGPRNP